MPRLSKSGVSIIQRGNIGFGETYLTRQEVVYENNLGVDQSRHMSSLTGQDRTGPDTQIFRTGPAGPD